MRLSSFLAVKMNLSLFKRPAAPLEVTSPVSAKEARKLILAGDAPAGLRVQGTLDLSNCADLVALPPGLQVHSLNLSNCTALRTLPCDLHVLYRLDLSGCTGLELLPNGLAVGTLILRNCANLRALPEQTNVFFLDISGCRSLHGWPHAGRVRFGHVQAAGCDGLPTLPPWLNKVAQLDLRDCTGITSLPEGLDVSSWIDIANTGITELPASLAGTELRWRGVPVDQRIVFHPETITVPEILQEANVERRRVLLERMGYEAFLCHARAEILDRDEDPGGERRLLKVPMRNDEDLVCLAVYCPSTGRQYVLRVPPKMRRCREAAAWIAGFDADDDYRPIAET